MTTTIKIQKNPLRQMAAYPH